MQAVETVSAFYKRRKNIYTYAVEGGVGKQLWFLPPFHPLHSGWRKGLATDSRVPRILFILSSRPASLGKHLSVFAICCSLCLCKYQQRRKGKKLFFLKSSVFTHQLPIRKRGKCASDLRLFLPPPPPPPFKYLKAAQFKMHNERDRASVPLRAHRKGLVGSDQRSPLV